MVPIASHHMFMIIVYSCCVTVGMSYVREMAALNIEYTGAYGEHKSAYKYMPKCVQILFRFNPISCLYHSKLNKTS